jgi:hypothetical protein
MRTLLLIAWCSSLVACACAGRSAAAPSDARAQVEPAPLLPPSAFPRDVQWRQRVTASWPTGTHSFDAVLQKRAGELILVGLSPLGMPGFVLRLREDRSIGVENHTGRALPFEPSYVLADVERVFFPWLPEDRTHVDGERSGMVAGMQVHERVVAGRIALRSFERVTPRGTERVRIEYSGWQAGQDAPARAALTNSALRYGLTIETIEQARLQ